jgi:tetratricopeptide (TPR) repeat protein
VIRYPPAFEKWHARQGPPTRVALTLLVLFWVSSTWGAADLAETKRLFISGQYRDCIRAAEDALKETRDAEEWQLVMGPSLLAIGEYPRAMVLATNALAQDRWSVRIKWFAREAFIRNGQVDSANRLLDDIINAVSSHPRDYRDAPSLVVFARAALLKGADPKKVLDILYESARKADAKERELYLAAGQLALDKHDYQLAAKKFDEGLKQLPDDPDLHFGLAQAFAPSDPALTSASVDKALSLNSNHVGCLLLLADNAIDSEDYAKASRLLERIHKIHPWQEEAWALRAVIAHLQNQPKAEQEARRAAFKFWAENPEVDHWIGRKLSQNYRFSEGAAYQRLSLQCDTNFVPAKSQLAQDLLRLGWETEGWRLVEEVQALDGYDVEAYNLATLRDSLQRFATITNRDFILRMDRREAALYGARALELLTKAKATLTAKYGLELKRPTTVEIFPEQKDFAVRTFGMPGNPGYLGVCFGAVITANSPAANPGHPVNWQAVLWHEFCHVVTLQLTRNKMPRWLSEGISVFEEMQANPSWGQRMNPRYRERILKGGLAPIGELSGAFLKARSDFDLQFAYYESALAVEYITGKYGLDALRGILRDLGEGMEVNKAITNHTSNSAELEKDFARFAREKALALAPGLDWDKPDFASTPEEESDAKPNRRRGPRVEVSGSSEWEEWARTRPTNFWVMSGKAEELVQARKWEEAKPILEKLIELYPSFTGAEGGYAMLSETYRNLGVTNSERKVLARWAELDDEAIAAYSRLMDLGAAAQDWPQVVLNAQRYLAVNPLVALPYRRLAEAAEKVGSPDDTIVAYRALLELDPPDPAEIHYRLALALFVRKDPESRRHVLQALEEAPRYRAALELLLKINREGTFRSSAANTSP